MSPNPILKVLSTFQRHRVQALLIGGQACIVYGAVEFSRDSDFAVLTTAANMRRLRSALAELAAEPIYFPPLSAHALRRGHACHFRCQADDVRGIRVDLLAWLRGCDDFATLWQRRTEVTVPDGTIVPVIGLRDLVRSKTTQRDKDWYMLSRLVENDIRLHLDRPEPEQPRWWLLSSRNPASLIDLARRFPEAAEEASAQRPLVRLAVAGDAEPLARALAEEEAAERELDRAYWQPLREELERMRLTRSRRGTSPRD